MTPITQPDAMPTHKVTAAAVAGALSAVLVWILTATGVDVPGVVAAAFTTILTFAAGYVVRERTVVHEGP